MNYNLIAYSIYAPIIFYIMIKVGWKLYKHGEIFLLNLFGNDISTVKNINNVLLTGFYLINLGYAVYTISYWEKIQTIQGLFNSLSHTLGKIIIILSILHYNNILCLTLSVKSKFLKQ